MSCDGHAAHHFERPADPDCDWCGHPESEHEDDGYWSDDRGKSREPICPEPATHPSKEETVVEP